MKVLKLNGDKLVTGKGTLDYIKEIKGTRIFIVTGGKSMFDNGTIDRIKNMLDECGKEYTIMSGIKKNPDTDIVNKGVLEMKKFKPDTVLALGGGSPIDAAKVMAVFYEYPNLNFENVLKGSLPEVRKNIEFISIPTTSGTGTEVTKAAVITYRDRDLKIGLKSNAFIPDIAILDPELTMSMPDNVVAETGMDALTHALECYINHNLDDFTESLAKGAIEGLFRYLPISYNEKTIESREKVHNYQCIAGMAFHNVGLGMAHGISHAFGGKYDLGHGLLNGIALPYVLHYNSKDPVVKEKLDYLAKAMKVDSMVEAVRNLNRMLNIPMSFKDAGINEKDFYNDFEELVKNSLKGSTRSNPIDISKEEMEKILKSIFEGHF
ncbi:iron-containing alcohol dehydrogenase [Wukongibacter baidiensis]|uniref:iron-containing alcohol dehydrogenase n=1 Tax=Wukongibacter baidiensis TaxID=1723361 RepID=UPI003D7F7B8C